MSAGLPSGAMQAALARLEPLRAAGHPLGGGERIESALRAGAAPHEALRAAGAAEAVVAWVHASAPSDLPAALTALAPVLGRAESRRAALRQAAVYPVILSGTSLFLALVLATGFRSSMATVAAGAGWTMLPAAIALAVAAAALFHLGAVLRGGLERFPFRTLALRHERARILGGAAAAIAQGAPLPAALRAGAALAPAGRAASSARELASALERGPAGAPVARALLGETGAAIFAAASAEGAGGASLTAIAALEEAMATHELPSEVLRAELLSLAIGGAAVATAAIAFISLYTHPFRGLS